MTRFMYLRDASRRPVAVIAYTAATEGQSRTSYKLGWAVWNPRDRFSYERGQQIATDRLEKCPIVGELHVKGGAALRRALLLSLRAEGHIPRRYRAAFEARLSDLMGPKREAA